LENIPLILYRLKQKDVYPSQENNYNERLLEEQRVLPNVIKVKNGIPTVIEWNGQRYIFKPLQSI